MMTIRSLTAWLVAGAALGATPAMAAWRAGNSDVEAAARDARIAGALAAVSC